MDATWSVHLAQTYFTHHVYFAVQCWINATYLSPETVNQMGPQTYCYAKVFVGRVGYMPLGALYDCIIAITDHFNAAMLFVLTAFLAL